MSTERREEIDRFIHQFSKYGKQVTTLFTEDCCYWFARILQERFPEGEILFLPEEHHFVVQIEDRLWDIRGNVTNRFRQAKQIPWGETRGLQRWRIQRDYVRKERICR